MRSSESRLDQDSCRSMDRNTLVLALVGPDPEQADLFEIATDDYGVAQYRVQDHVVSREIYELALATAKANLGFPEMEEDEVLQ